MNKKVIWFVLVCMVSVGSPARDVFGVEHNGNTKDNLINLLYSLSKDDTESATLYYTRLQKTAPALTQTLTIDDLKIPCTQDAKGFCSGCEGEKGVIDRYALSYLQNRFCSAVNKGQTVGRAWRNAKAAFDQRRENVLNERILNGVVLQRDGAGWLLTLQESEEVVYIKGASLAGVRAGLFLDIQAWPRGTRSRATGAVKSYVTNLWVD